MIPRQRESSKAGIFLQVVSRETMPSGTKFSHLRSTWNIKFVVQTSLRVTEETHSRPVSIPSVPRETELRLSSHQDSIVSRGTAPTPYQK